MSRFSFTAALISTAAAVTSAQAQTTNVGNSQIEWSTTQGTNGWSYGYYNRSADGDATYSGAEFQLLPNSYVLGGNPPWTSITSPLDTHPNHTNSGGEHWTVRRYTVTAADAAGAIDLNWLIRKTNTACGDGVVGYVYHNGTQVDTSAIGAADGTGTFRRLTIPTVGIGDTIDLMVSPGAGNDFCDGTAASMEMHRRNTYTGIPTTLVADSVADFGQNTNGWTYGLYNITANGAPGPGEFIPFSPTSWTGSYWDLATPAAPWTEVAAGGGHPNGTNNGEEHWATRRYTVQPGENGNLIVEWDISKGNPFGAGTSVHILWNGVEVASTGVRGDDMVGWTGSLALPGTQVGDTIDIALAPQGQDAQLLGTGDNSDGADGSVFAMRVFMVPEPGTSAVLIAAFGLLGLRRSRRQ